MNTFVRATSSFLMLLAIGTSLPLFAHADHDNHGGHDHGDHDHHSQHHDRREIARGSHPDDDDNMLFDRNQRRENWDYQEGWRYDEEAFFNGDLTPAPTPFDREERHLPNHGH